LFIFFTFLIELNNAQCVGCSGNQYATFSTTYSSPAVSVVPFWAIAAYTGLTNNACAYCPTISATNLAINPSCNTTSGGPTLIIANYTTFSCSAGICSYTNSTVSSPLTAPNVLSKSDCLTYIAAYPVGYAYYTGLQGATLADINNRIVCGCHNQGTSRRTSPHPVGVDEFKIKPDGVSSVGGLQQRQAGSQCPNRNTSLPINCNSSLLCNSSDHTQNCTNCVNCPYPAPTALNCNYLWACYSNQTSGNPACGNCAGFNQSGWGSASCPLGASPAQCPVCNPAPTCPIPQNPQEGCSGSCNNFIGKSEGSNCPPSTTTYPCLSCHLMNYYNTSTNVTSLICASHLAPAATECYCAAYPGCNTGCNSGNGLGGVSTVGMNRICAPWNSGTVITMQCIAGCVGGNCSLASVNDCNQGVAIPAGAALNGTNCPGAYSCGGTICATPVTASGSCSNTGSYSQTSTTTNRREDFRDKIDPTTGVVHEGIPVKSNV